MKTLNSIAGNGNVPSTLTELRDVATYGAYRFGSTGA